MQTTNTSSHTDPVKHKSLLRKFIVWFSPRPKITKIGYGLFGGTALFGTAVLVASASGGNNAVPDHTVPPQTTNQAQPLTAPSQELPIISVQDNSSNDSGHKSSGNASSSNTNGQSRASVNVNGQNIELNGDGEVHKTIKNGNSTTQVDISVDSSGSNISSSHTSVQSHSFSSGTSSLNVHNSTEVSN